LHNEQPRPFLRWAGSKRQLLPVLAQYWNPNCTRYVEPFAGSACLYFALCPPQALLGDINRDLIETYRSVKHRPSAIAAALAQLPKSREEYSRQRTLEIQALTPAERAARFIYLNRYCFNGLYRTNLQGKFNVPYGGDKAGRLPTREALMTCSRQLRTTALIYGDFETILRHVEPGDFVYMDPPFSVRGRRIFNEYDPAAFGSQDLKRLREWMDHLTLTGVPFLVSYAESEEAVNLARGYNSQRVSVRRNIAGFAGHRIRSVETLISNYPPSSD
jgi:DNA adenine methylase